MSGGRKSELDETSTRSSSLCGYLWKMKRSHQKRILVPQWNKRWFSIEGRLLKWYTVAQAEESSGMVDLRFITNVSAFEAQGVFSFILSYPDRNLLLRASNLSDMNKWIRALQFQTDIVRGGCGMTIVTDCNTSGSSPQGKGRAVKEKYRPPTLEANLEAAMVRLQILENRVLKQSYESAKHQTERPKKEVARDEKSREREKGNDECFADLRPEDVSLYERDKMRSGSHKNDWKTGEQKNFRGTSSKSGGNNDRNHALSQDCEDDHDQSISRESKYAQSPAISGRIKTTDSPECSYSEREREPNRGQRGAVEESRKKICLIPTHLLLPDSREEPNLKRNVPEDDCIEEILPTVRNSARARCQVSRMRDEREREKERVKAISASNDNILNCKSNSSKQQNNSDWGYDGEMYNNCHDKSFDGGVSHKQSVALFAAASARISSAGSVRSDAGSIRSTHVRNDIEKLVYEDLPEMDLIVRKPSQRRERKHERDLVNKTVGEERSPGISNGIGWV